MNKCLSFFVIFLSCVLFSLAHAEEEIKPQVLMVDSDGDGVIDKYDECYKTPPGTSVDERGCYVVIKESNKITLNINFEFDSSVVRPEYFSEVEKVAVFMRENPLTRVTIEGHSDSDGPSEYNKGLSHRRAQAVARVLVVQFNIPTPRVTAIGFGEDRPLVANDSKSNKLKNRRVVAVIKTLREKRG